MSDETARGGEETGAPVAVSLALTGASRQEADAFLRDQRHHMQQQLKEIGLRLWELRLGVLLRIATAFVGVAVTSALVITIWNAAHADGLIVESFKVPPELVEKGLSGDVVASQVLDQLAAFQAQSSNAIQAPSNIANSWSDDLKVEIPETGVSLGEFNRYLHRWLGHETHISGEVVRLEGSTIEITARVNSEAGQSFSGSDFHALVAKAAEAIYAATQPIRYGNVLNVQGRFAEQDAFILAHTRTGPQSQRAWAYTNLSSLALRRNQPTDGIRYAREGVTLSPSFAFGWYRLAQAQVRGDVLQGALDAAKKSLSLTGNGQTDLLPIAVAQGQAADNALIAVALGDIEQQLEQGAAVWPMIDFAADPVTQTRQAENATGGTTLVPIGYQGELAIARIGQHDLAAARRVLAREPLFIAALKANPVAVRRGLIDGAANAYRSAEVALGVETNSWDLVRKLVPPMEAYVARRTAAGLASQTVNLQAELWPQLALAQAQMGDFAAAHAQIDKTAGDCDLCLRTRAKIDALQKNFAGADFWLARLEAMEPSIPFADSDWGRSLLERGQFDGAIEKFKLASQKGPHFADPLEGWGEALMAKNQSHKALEKFAAAEKYAPNWGRLHLKWGEALAYSGNKEEAAKQFARAAALDLTPSEKSELQKVPHV